MPEMDDHSFAAWAAEQAGALLLEVRGRGLEGTALKDAGDLASHELLMSLLATHRPDDAVLSEEEHRGTTSAHDRRTADRVWIIDPLDGTTNFIHGFPQYAVSIALARSGVVEQAVVYDVVRNELFTASKGSGAFLNDRRIRVSRRTRLNEALLGTGFPFRQMDNVEAYLGMFRELTQKTAGIRRPGSAALDLAYLAAGRYDAFWELGLAPWDIAAGTLLVTEAGGLVSDLAGESDYLATGNLVAGTPKIFTQVLPVIRSHLPANIPA